PALKHAPIISTSLVSSQQSRTKLGNGIRDRNDVIELKLVLAATVHTFAFVPLPDKQTHRLGNTFTTGTWNGLKVLERLNLIRDPLQSPVFSKNSMFNTQNEFGPVEAFWHLNSNESVPIDPSTILKAIDWQRLRVLGI